LLGVGNADFTYILRGGPRTGVARGVVEHVNMYHTTIEIYSLYLILPFDHG